MPSSRRPTHTHKKKLNRIFVDIFGLILFWGAFFIGLTGLFLCILVFNLALVFLWMLYMCFLGCYCFSFCSLLLACLSVSLLFKEREKAWS